MSSARLGNYLKAAPHPLSTTKPLEIPDTLFERLSEEVAIELADDPPNEVDRTAWRNAVLTRYAQDNLATKDREVAGRMVKEFNEWILGKHPKYNIKDAPKNKPTWWGRRRLVGEDFDIYFKNILKNQADFIEKLSILRIGIPENLPDAWLYFIFFVYEWPNMPNGWTPDKLFFDEMKSFYNWTEGKNWKSILDTDKDVPITGPSVVTAEVQELEAAPRFIGGTISEDKLLNFRDRSDAILLDVDGNGDDPIDGEVDPNIQQRRVPSSTVNNLNDTINKLIATLERDPGKISLKFQNKKLTKKVGFRIVYNIYNNKIKIIRNRRFFVNCLE
jgi:hypothetical protein